MNVLSVVQKICRKSGFVFRDMEQRNLPGGHSSYREQLWNRSFLAALTSGGDGWRSQAKVHGHLRSHGQQVVLKSLLHQTLLLFSQTGHFPFWPFASTCLQLFSQLLQGGSSGQTCNLLLTKSQRHGGSCCHNGGRQILWNKDKWTCLHFRHRTTTICCGAQILISCFVVCWLTTMHIPTKDLMTYEHMNSRTLHIFALPSAFPLTSCREPPIPQG